MAKIVDPELVADIVSELNVQGAIAPFEISEVAVPVFDIGKLGSLGAQQVVTPGNTNTVEIGVSSQLAVFPQITPSFASTQVVPDTQNAIASGTVLADSGQLPAGNFWVDCNISHNDGGTIDVALQWRNAANAANILEIPFMMGLRAGKLFAFSGIAVDERFRLVTNTAITGIIHSYMATRLTFVPIAT